MDSRIVHFITALRASGVRISLAESQDAFYAIDRLGIEDREVFRVSLKSTLIKEAKDGPTFERLFQPFEIVDGVDNPGLRAILAKDRAARQR